ncbi:hypothetical protein EXIGLDRAFT_653585 [Exidia glandulosa HHB12029]|uniref:ER membrane protein complex subunit 6 n=1 Tax=Exidia glandulosa HHB12029 TaxID=1314781 RepID=A0A165E3L8_EXIGL|nr:hypothetical protein EXIGLDRAFT_653585 [Exidia glandulosa HHB12029]
MSTTTTAGPADGGEQQLLYAANVLHNTSVQSVKFYAACFAGAVAGTLGLETWRGFAVFALASAFGAAIVVAVNCKGRPKAYFQGGAFELANPGQDNLMSFILMWTLFYGIVHVYD